MNEAIAKLNKNVFSMLNSKDLISCVLPPKESGKFIIN